MTLVEIDLPSIERQGDELVRTLHLGGRAMQTRMASVRPDVGPVLDWWHAYWRSRPAIREDLGLDLRFGELFCGAGGLAIGARRAAEEFGYATSSVFANDLDDEAVEVYAKNQHTETPIAGSVTGLLDFQVRGRGGRAAFRYPPEVLHKELRSKRGHLDVLLGGPPCQGYSQLNNHSYHDDSRNELFLTIPAAAIALGVPHVVIENVLGVARDPDGVVGQSRQLLENAGYSVEAGVLRAADLGWPQRRKRFFLVASTAVAPLPLDEVVDLLRARPCGVIDAIGDLDFEPDTDILSRTVSLADVTKQRVDWLFDNDAYELPNSERPDCHQDGTTYTSVYGRMRPDEPSPTITTGFSTVGQGRFVHPTERRPITAREAARLQGFQDTYDFSLDGGLAPSRAKITKWIGDAVPMPLGHAAMSAILLPLVGALA